jgi:glycosyltransferase involved in cell wall biosynthesis
MKILFVSDFYPPHHKGGAEVSTSLLAEALSPHHEVRVICNTTVKTPWRYRGIQAQPLLRIADVGARGLGDALRYAFGIAFFPILNAIVLTRQTYGSRRPDLVQIVPSSYQFIPLALYARFILRLPVAIDCRDYSLICPTNLPHDYQQSYRHGYDCLKGYAPENPILSLFASPFAYFEASIFMLNTYLLRQALARTSRLRLVAISDYIAGALRTVGYLAGAISTIPNIAPVVSAPATRARTHFTFAGRLDESKGVWDVVRAALILKQTSAPIDIDIIGEGAASAELKSYARHHQLTRVKFLGKLSTDAVLEHYAASQAVVAPSRWPEPFGRFIQEASATSTPVIATRVGGIPEAITHNVNGILVSPDSPQELAQAITNLAQDPAKRQRLGRAMSELQSQFSAAAIMARRLALYALIIAGTSVGA